MNETDLVELRPDMLELAIQHVEECLQAACFLDSIANRVFIAGDAEMLLEKIRVDFASLAKNGSIILTRSELTARYCHHRNRGIPVAELYQRLIPTLIDQGNAKILSKNGRQERYAFRTQSVE